MKLLDRHVWQWDGAHQKFKVTNDVVVAGQYLTHEPAYVTAQERPVYRDKNGHLVISTEGVAPTVKQVTGDGLVSEQTRLILGADLKPKARADLVTRDGGPVYLKVAKGAEDRLVRVPADVAGHALRVNGVVSRETYQALESAITKAKNAGDTILLKALSAAKKDGTYQTKADVEAAVKSYDENSRKAQRFDELLAEVPKLDADVNKVKGLDARLMRRVSGATPEAKLAQIKSALAEQTKIQALINDQEKTAAGKAIAERMNAKDYASEQAAQEDLALQVEAQRKLDKLLEKDAGAKIVDVKNKPRVLDGHNKPADGNDASAVNDAQKDADLALDAAIARATKANDVELVAALKADKAARVYHTKAEVEAALTSVDKVKARASEWDASSKAMDKFDAALKNNAALGARMNRFAKGRDFAQVQAGLDEQTKIQALINDQEKTAGGKAIAERMNAKDYASEQQARADLKLQEQAQVLLDDTLHRDKTAHIKDVDGQPRVLDGQNQAVLPSEKGGVERALKDGKDALEKAQHDAAAEKDPKLKEALKEALNKLKTPTKREVEDTQVHVREQLAREAAQAARREVDQALDAAINKAKNAGDTVLVDALTEDKAAGTYQTKADVEAAVKSYESSREAVKTAEQRAGQVQNLNNALDSTPGLDARLIRKLHGIPSEKRFDEVTKILAEQQRVQTLINSLPKKTASDQAIVLRMNAKDYASTKDVQADFALQKATQAHLDQTSEAERLMADAIAQAHSTGNSDLEKQLKLTWGKVQTRTPEVARELIAKVRRAQALLALDLAIARANEARNTELLRSLMAAKASGLFKTKEQVDTAVKEIESALAQNMRNRTPGDVPRAVSALESRMSEEVAAGGESTSGMNVWGRERNARINSEDMVTDEYGRVRPVAHLRTMSGYPVYRRADGNLTTDMHGGPMPPGEVVVDDRELQKNATVEFGDDFGAEKP